MFNTLFDHSGFAVNLTSVILSLALIMARVLSVNLPPFFQAFNHLSPAKWSVGNLAPYTLRSQTSTCSKSQQLSNNTCSIITGQQVLELHKFNSDPGRSLAALGACTIAYRIAAYLLLKAMKMPPFQYRLQHFMWPKRQSWVKTISSRLPGQPLDNAANCGTESKKNERFGEEMIVKCKKGDLRYRVRNLRSKVLYQLLSHRLIGSCTKAHRSRNQAYLFLALASTMLHPLYSAKSDKTMGGQLQDTIRSP